MVNPYGNSINHKAIVFDKELVKLSFKNKKDFNKFFKNPYRSVVINFLGTNYLVMNLHMMFSLIEKTDFFKINLDEKGNVFFFFNEKFSLNHITVFLQNTVILSRYDLHKISHGYFFISKIFQEIMNNCNIHMCFNENGMYADLID